MHWLLWRPLWRKSWADMLPNDPVILLSVLNTKLRDEFGSLDELCAVLDVRRKDLTDRLASIGYTYQKEQNQFI